MEAQTDVPGVKSAGRNAETESKELPEQILPEHRYARRDACKVYVNSLWEDEPIGSLAEALAAIDILIERAEKRIPSWRGYKGSTLAFNEEKLIREGTWTIYFDIRMMLLSEFERRSEGGA